MKKTFLNLSLIAALSGVTTVVNAQLVVWSTTNFVNDPVGLYGATVDFQGGDNVTNSIVDPGMNGPGSHAWEIRFSPTNQPNVNFQTTGIPYPATGNTNTFLANYTLSFDMQVTGNDVSPGSGIQISVFANQTGANGYAVFGPNLLLPSAVTNVFTAGTGYHHYSFPLSSFNNNGFNVNATNFSVGIGYVSYPALLTASPEIFDIANLQITMITNPPPPPQPVMTVLPAKPGLRIFAQDRTHTYNQEGFSSQDNQLSWVGTASPDFPVSYTINIGDFDTVNGYTLYIQFVQNASSGDPYGVYFGTNAFVWSITHQATGFTTGVAWKTNAPTGNTSHIALPTTTTTSTTGRGKWTLTFTNDLDGTITMPDGSVTNFSLPDEIVASDFANPLIIDFGTAPNSTAGYGQYIDLSGIVVSNTGYYENDDFTQDSALISAWWNPGFSLNPGSVILVTTNTPYWVNWTIPDDGFGLGVKASLLGGTNTWFSPAYYGSAAGVTNTTPTLMGQSLKWTLIPAGCLPTVEGTPGGTPSATGFFRLLNPAPGQ